MLSAPPETATARCGEFSNGANRSIAAVNSATTVFPLMIVRGSGTAEALAFL
jgi:hypothetical protein